MNKASGRQNQHRTRYNTQFERRYGMKRTEWLAFKNEAKASGAGHLIDEKRQTAYARAIS